MCSRFHIHAFSTGNTVSQLLCLCCYLWFNLLAHSGIVFVSLHFGGSSSSVFYAVKCCTFFCSDNFEEDAM